MSCSFPKSSKINNEESLTLSKIRDELRELSGENPALNSSINSGTNAKKTSSPTDLR